MASSLKDCPVGVNLDFCKGYLGICDEFLQKRARHFSRAAISRWAASRIATPQLLLAYQHHHNLFEAPLPKQRALD